MSLKLMLSLAIVSSIGFVGPANAQSQIDNNQPVQGTLHSRAADLQNKLNASYKAGFISSTELATMQRDLDGILVKADRKSMKDSNQNTDFDGISAEMSNFEKRLIRGENRKVGSDNSNRKLIAIPGAKPLTGNQSSTVQPTSETYIVPATPEVVPVGVPVAVPN